MSRKTALLTFLIGIFINSGPGICQNNMPVSVSSQKTPSLTAEQIIEKLETRYNAADFSAEFSQESTLKALDITDTAAGKVWFKNPGMMRWEYERPEKYAIISDGENLWIYRPEDNQVVTGNAMTYFSNGKGASFLSNFKRVQDVYTVSVVPSKNDGQSTLKLVPHQKQLDLSAIFINIEKKSFDIKNVLTLNDYGDETRIEFSNLEFGELEDSLFNFQIPPGADILKLDE